VKTNPPAVEAVLKHLANSDEPLRSAKLAELSNLGAGEIANFEKAWAGTELNRRRHIMNRLVELAEDNARLDFESVFRNRLEDPDEEVRSKAIEGLLESEDTSLISPLISLLEKDSSKQVQAAAATALGKFVMLAELEKLRSSHKSRIAQVLLRVFDDRSRSVEVKRRALEAVAPLSLPEVKQAITKAYQSHNPKLKASAVYAMGKNCDSSWLGALFQELSGKNGEARYEACGACGEIGDEEAVPHLAELVHDSDIEVRLSAIRALGKIGGARAEGCLKPCLSSRNEAVKEAAEEALSEMESEEELYS
jgi:HEAT repeat protein